MFFELLEKFILLIAKRQIILRLIIENNHLKSLLLLFVVIFSTLHWHTNTIVSTLWRKTSFFQWQKAQCPTTNSLKVIADGCHQLLIFISWNERKRFESCRSCCSQLFSRFIIVIKIRQMCSFFKFKLIVRLLASISRNWKYFLDILLSTNFGL